MLTDFTHGTRHPGIFKSSRKLTAADIALRVLGTVLLVVIAEAHIQFLGRYLWPPIFLAVLAGHLSVGAPSLSEESSNLTKGRHFLPKSAQLRLHPWESHGTPMVSEQGVALWSGFVTSSLQSFPENASCFICVRHRPRLTFKDFSLVYLEKALVHFCSFENRTPFSHLESHLWLPESNSAGFCLKDSAKEI